MNTPFFNGPILFACTAHAGQINPLLTIAAELSRRNIPGLCFASTDNRRAKIEEAATGSSIDFISCGADDRTKELMEDPAVYSAVAEGGPMTTKSFLLAMRWMFDQERLAVDYRVILAQIDRVRPRLMIIDISTISGLDVAMARKIPFILSMPAMPSGLFIERLPWDYPLLGSGLPRRMNAAQKAANFWYRLRLQASTVTQFPYFSFAGRRMALGMVNPFASMARYCDAASAIFCYSIFGLEYPFRVPKNLQMLGAMIPVDLRPTRSDGEELSQWLDRHSSVVYVGFGTLVRLSEAQVTTLIKAFARLGPQHRVLWKLPSSQRAFWPAHRLLPANIRIEEWVPSQLRVLAHPNVRAFVTHGGGNGFHEGIYFGKPLLVMPFWLDCFDFAVRALDSQVGLALERPPAFTADEVATKLERLLADSRFHERAQYWGAQLRKAGGVDRAADLILERLRHFGRSPE